MDKVEKIKVFVAEDHPIVRQGIRSSLEQDENITVVGEAGDGENALTLVQSLRPDVLVCDIRLPKINGIELIRKIKKSTPNTKCLMLSAYDDDEYILALMGIGASGYLLKTVEASEFVKSIYKIYSGEIVLDSVISDKVTRLWAKGPVKKYKDALLSPKERKILDLAASGLKNNEIALSLKISIRTVETHFYNIYTKLSVTSRSEAIIYALSSKMKI